MKDIALVVPTIRESCFNDFVKRWDAIGLFQHVDLIVMEDNPHKTFGQELMPKQLTSSSLITQHYCWEDIEKELGTASWIIPRRSDTVRSFAYYMAAKLGYKYTMTLDDDCYPTTDEDGLRYDGEGFVKEHLKSLGDKSYWFNTLNDNIPRGVPYYNKGQNKNVMVNHGLWTNVLDYDAPHQLVLNKKENFKFDSQIVPNGMFFPMCGMNVMWKTEVTVLMYHLLMGHQVVSTHNTLIPTIEKLPFDRFGDIWCGIFMKKILDLKEKNVSTGMPYIRHERASNPFTNLKKEANGIEVNEKLWEYVQKFDGLSFDDNSWSGLYERLGIYIVAYEEFPEHQEYFVKLGNAMQKWSSLFMKKEDNF